MLDKMWYWFNHWLGMSTAFVVGFTGYRFAVDRGYLSSEPLIDPVTIIGQDTVFGIPATVSITDFTYTQIIWWSLVLAAVGTAVFWLLERLFPHMRHGPN